MYSAKFSVQFRPLNEITQIRLNGGIGSQGFGADLNPFRKPEEFGSRRRAVRFTLKFVLVRPRISVVLSVKSA